MKPRKLAVGVWSAQGGDEEEAYSEMSFAKRYPRCKLQKLSNSHKCSIG